MKALINRISKIKHIEKLELKNSRQITKNCLPYINTLKELVLLNLMMTSITLNDLMVLKDLQNLKELYMSSDKDDDYNLEKNIQMKDILPNCIVFVNYETLE
jgi:hypothetical protein